MNPLLVLFKSEVRFALICLAATQKHNDLDKQHKKTHQIINKKDCY